MEQPDKMRSIRLPARWVAFLRDGYKVLGLDYQEELTKWTKSVMVDIVGSDLPDARFKELVKKHQLADVFPEEFQP